VVAHTGINPNTVLKAYRQLDAEGLVETRAGAGTFVIQTPARAEVAQATQAGAALTTWVREARSSGLDRAEVEAIFKSAVDDAFEERA
jgi:GntR family transcriptional regulator